jgi:hypothetical protein
MYRPHVVALRANQKLRVLNSDNTTHNIHHNPPGLRLRRASPARRLPSR